ncbi:MAG: excinuclease ABC subunit C [Opitutus sp.]|nr:excinuclease ABC subunit C [Opitutus sp.]
MTYVYLIESVRHRARHYVGITSNLKSRLTDHNRGASPHTSKFRPWHLVAYFAFAEQKTAHAFEHYLKTGSGKAFLKKRFLHAAPSRAAGSDLSRV